MFALRSLTESALTRSPAASTSRVLLRSAAPRRAAVRFASTTSGSGAGSHARQTPRFTAAALALLGTTAYIATRSSAEPVQASTAAVLDPNDPLSALSPQVLHQATAHLQEVGLADLVRQYVVYLGSSQAALVEAGPWMLKKLEWARDNVPVLGTAVWGFFAISMKSTFYTVFVGGPTVPDCAPLVHDYLAHGVGCLLNYSAEASVDGSAQLNGVNDDNIIETVNALEASAKFTTSSAEGYSLKPTLFATKLTGLIFEPQLLSRASSALVNSSSYSRGTPLPSSVLFPDAPELSAEDQLNLKKLHDGLRKICAEAKKGGVRILVDAEQTWFQPAIDRYVDLLAEEFNKVTPENSTDGPAIPIVYNTYQAYLRSAPSRMSAAIAHADANGYAFGAKLVRGAYVESERKRWELAGAVGDCPIWSNKQQSDDCYDDCALMLEKRISDEVLGKEDRKAGTGAIYATHNGTSVKKVLSALAEQGLVTVTDEGLAVDERIRGRISFAQLHAMSDNLTNALVRMTLPPAENAHSTIPIVVKYVPYATFDQALPYLIRRANENQSILQSDPTSGRGGAKGERKAVGREIRRRIGIPF